MLKMNYNRMFERIFNRKFWDFFIPISFVSFLIWALYSVFGW